MHLAALDMDAGLNGYLTLHLHTVDKVALFH